jgi:ATP-dependent Clp protease ATP-binding subunit ClpC
MSDKAAVSLTVDGRLTDAKGRTADARNAIFIMTSNITLQHEARRPLGFGAEPEPEQATDVRRELARRFRPEFINRIDEIVVFKPLGQDSARLILRGMLADIAARLLKQHGITLEVSEEAEELLLRAGFSAAFGARELRRTVERMPQEVRRVKGEG